jgi:pimeloyl-ACP methyl ester carboxylesterase
MTLTHGFRSRRELTCTGSLAGLLAVLFTVGIATTAFSAPRHSGARASDSASTTNFSPVGSRHEFNSERQVYEWRFQARRGSSPFDRIGLHRIDRPSAKAEAVVLFLPGQFMNGEVVIDNPRYSFGLYLAKHDIDFWALDYRTHFIPPATPQAKLTELKGWTDDLFESDIDAAVRFVLSKTGSKQLYLAGFSHGATLAYLYATLHPGTVAGLIILDGAIPTRKAGQPPPDHYADDVGGRNLTYKKRQALLEAVIRDPKGPAPLSKYKTASENLAGVVYGSNAFGGHGGLANPQGGFSDPVVLAHALIKYDRYWPTVQDYENPFTSPRLGALGSSGIPVLAFASTKISKSWTDAVTQSALMTGTVDALAIPLKGWGHLDVLYGNRAHWNVYGETLTWIRQHLTSAADSN